ncbi:hypothetical protein Pmar_PMAR018670 [Perkinsus marinus ATCC 50983]|uniref:Uncharacterized protein n=2 Tax=Perkinsus marinus (strain ATCC 50983 / TXsc) TaxID=423536 RepID=C5LYP9_PERM5|nr:hypothetical protein Pmar_PMAR018670 [Perkinsus marinus ATCC 50983]EEQ98143.1 hypothetical protein Pmar_PMAR018670 [Perkinsus marinus ATCC 50983]|eukprot:XP_002765426.1 hypothetical protein Pmar_PMAR018670 [Perkinsus marinus ATCC 50983]
MPRDWQQQPQQGEDDKKGGYDGGQQSKGWDDNSGKNWKGASRGWNKGGGGGGDWKSNNRQDSWKDNDKSWEDNDKSNWRGGGGNRSSGWKSSPEAEGSKSKSWQDSGDYGNKSWKSRDGSKWGSSEAAGGDSRWKEGEQSNGGEPEAWKDTRKENWRGGGGWEDERKGAKNWEDDRNKDVGNGNEKADPWKQHDSGYIDGEKEDGQELDSGDYDDDVDDEDAAIADMEYSDDWTQTLVWVRNAVAGQLEFTIGDIPEFDIPGSRPLKIPVVSGEMEELVFAPRLEAKDDDDVWKRVTDGGKVEMVKMCMGKDRNGVLVLEHPTADNDYRDPDPTTLHSPKEFWTLVTDIPTRKMCVTQGDRVLYFDSWSQLDTPYISATYATKQDRGSVLLGDSTDRSWEGFSVGVKLSNPEPRSNAGDWGGEGDAEDGKKSDETHGQPHWFNISLNRGKLNIWVPSGPIEETDEKILVFEHYRKESTWIIPEAWLRTGIPDADVDEALESKQPIKSMNGYVYAQHFYGTVQSLHKHHNHATGDEDDAEPIVAPPEVAEIPPIEQQIMNMSKSFWHEREGREGRLQQLREKCQVMKDYNDNLASQLEEAEGLYKDLFEKVQQMKEKIGFEAAGLELAHRQVTDGTESSN